MASRSSFDESTCPNCGYMLVGLPSRTCPECGLAFDSAAMRRLRRRRARRWMIAALVMFIALYAPHVAWLTLIDYPWNDYRWSWITLLPATPTLMPMHFAINALNLEAEHGAGFWLLQAVGLLSWLLCTWLSIRGRRWWVWLLALSSVLLLLQIAHAFALYHAFLM